MTLKRPALVLLAILPCLTVPLQGQAAPPGKGRSVRTVFFKRPPGMPETAVLYAQSGNVRVELPPMNLSEPVAIPAGDLVFSILPEAPQADAPLPPGSPQVRIPAAWPRVLLLFFPDPSNKVFPVRVLPVDGSLEKFKPGDLLCFNLTTAQVGGALGTSKFRIASGKSETLKPSRTDSGDYTVAVDCLLPGETTPRPLCRTVWRHDPDIRQLLFIINSADRPVPRIWSISETVRRP